MKTTGGSNTALALLRTPELYDLDLRRMMQQLGEKEIYWNKMGIHQGPRADIYSEERRVAALRPWNQGERPTSVPNKIQLPIKPTWLSR